MGKSFCLRERLIDWRFKALLQLTLSWLPRGERLNYLVQRYVVGSLPASDAEFSASVSYAKRHFNALQRNCSRPLSEASFYEFGAGWDMTIPLAFYGFGIGSQIVVDIRNLLRPHIFNLTIDKFQIFTSELAIIRRPSAHFDQALRGFSSFLSEEYSIDYRAPCDARHTGLPSSTVDCITSTSTLEHIPANDTRLILRECRRILRDDGLISILIDYDDHYSYFDSKISSYNFLKYSDRHWALFNPPLHYQNRLRHTDYVKLFESEGFEIVEEQRRDGRDAELKTIEQMSISDRFKTYSLLNLAVRNALFVLRKQG